MLRIYNIRIAGTLMCSIKASNLRVAINRSLKETGKHPRFGYYVERERFTDKDLPLQILVE